MKHSKENIARFKILLVLFTLFNLVQAAFTGLLHDEAYYWVYSQNLDWGYFDHPPMVAVFIAADWLWHHPLMTRLISVLGMSVALWFVYFRVAKSWKPLPFFLIFLSLALLSSYSFLIVPDTPLILFSIAFFISLRSYLEKDSWKNAAWLMLWVALLFYSKYHAVLWVLFTLIAWPALFRRPSFYVITLGAVALCLPHILWQVEHDFISLQFHLQDRSQAPYQFTNSTEYLLGQLLIIGPLTFWFWFNRMSRPEKGNAWERILVFNFWGVLAFFFLMTFKGRVEANWTVMAHVPAFLLLISHPFHFEKRIEKIFYKLSLATVCILVVLRVSLMLPIHQWISIPIKSEFFAWKEWAMEIQAKAEGRSVVFASSYQRPSLYMFYTSDTAISHNSVHYRANQYDLWDYAKGMEGKEVLYVTRNQMEKFDTDLFSADGQLWYKSMKKYLPICYLVFESHFEIIETKRGQDIDLNGIWLGKTELLGESLSFYATWYRYGVITESYPIQMTEAQGVFTFSLAAPLFPGDYRLKISPAFDVLEPTVVGHFIKVEVK
jgi:hypothetical protein